MNTATPTIRPVRAEDMAAITAIYRVLVDASVATYELQCPDVADMQRRMESILADGYPYLVAERNGQLAGYAYVTSYRARRAYRFTVENTVYVDAAHQGRSIGAALLQALIDACALQAASAR